VTDEYVLDCRLKNNLIVEAIRRQGYATVAQFCDAYGLYQSSIGDLINLKERAMNRDGTWRKDALRLANALQVEPDMLFTEQQRITELPTNRAMVELSERQAIAMATDPYQLAARADMAKNIHKLLSSLPYREQKVLRMRFFENASLQDVADEFDITRERVRQIEGRALAKLRHPSTSGHMRDFIE
jgi:RNA polymerase sigma factor (sigma-70 family)